ncbi:hypothetical protein [Kribbella sp. NPDC004875]|uniref:hypothetical protein n=1 Tax=Kribbella sp. NPDC004875 TaxID=3364107 RepID=UPI0036B5E313
MDAPRAQVMAESFASPADPGTSRRARGNLIGLAMVVGLLAFFLADGTQSGLDPVVTFFVAAGALVMLFFGSAVVAVAVQNRRTLRGSREVAPGPDVAWPQLAWQGREPASEGRGSRPWFATAAQLESGLDDLLAVSGQVPAAEIDRALTDLVRYLTVEPEQRRQALTTLLDARRPTLLWGELMAVARLADHAPEPVRRAFRDRLARRLGTP